MNWFKKLLNPSNNTVNPSPIISSEIPKQILTEKQKNNIEEINFKIRYYEDKISEFNAAHPLGIKFENSDQYKRDTDIIPKYKSIINKLKIIINEITKNAKLLSINDIYNDNEDSIKDKKYKYKIGFLNKYYEPYDYKISFVGFKENTEIKQLTINHKENPKISYDFLKVFYNDDSLSEHFFTNYFIEIEEPPSQELPPKNLSSKESLQESTGGKRRRRQRKTRKQRRRRHYKHRKSRRMFRR